MSSKDGRPSHVEKPLKGTVLCCTAIAPEQRTHMAEAAIQMGAEHKLDLTSDVSHLIVGDSNTAKYKYVARERDDVRVVQLAWVEAVRQAWMRGDDVNIRAFEEQYRLPTFAGLRICITGFEDLSLRNRLQDTVLANGGEYRGDLTKEVTHLIAHTAGGQKYQHATQWDIKVVTIKWLDDCLHRRMILDERLYHPTIPRENQGAGAWNRHARAELQLGKRTRDEETVPDVPRKLRRTASAKLGSQSEGLWDEIVSGPQGDVSKENRQLRPSNLSPALNLKSAILEPKSFATDIGEVDDDQRKQPTRDMNTTAQQRSIAGLFQGFAFSLYAFTAKQESILRSHVLSNDGAILDFMPGLEHISTSHFNRSFIIVPYSHPSSDMPSLDHLEPLPEIVTDLWAERCLLFKKFFEPEEHMLSRPIRVFPIPGFASLVVNSTGIADIDLLHVSKAVRLLGAEYNQVLKPGISVLVCNPNKAGPDKLRHAFEWRIPVVSIEWLWSCIRGGQMQPFDAFLLRHGPEEPRQQDVGFESKAAGPPRISESAQIGRSDSLARTKKDMGLAQDSEDAVDRNTLASEADSYRNMKAPVARMAVGEGFLKSPPPKKSHAKVGRDEMVAAKDRKEATKVARHEEYVGDHKREADIDVPLQEVSTNSPIKIAVGHSPRKARLFRNFEGHASAIAVDQGDDTPSAPSANSTAKTSHISPQPQSINGAIQDLLSKSRAKNAIPATTNGEKKKRRLLGRGVSNISNSSREGSNARASRASSIDSVNTDGLGNVILDDTPQSTATATPSMKGKPNFTGRVSAQRQNLNDRLFEPGDAALYREEYQEEEEPPQMTQLGYENPEDAVALREMLAERRRNRSRKGQEDSKPAGKPAGKKDGKRIKDDVIVEAAGWGSGRRTRQKMKSP